VSAKVGEEFCGSLAAILREIRGERERRWRNIYRRRRGKLLLPESMGFNSGKNFTAGSTPAEETVWGRRS
jgi:hypothetical protein